ncbi:MAG: hypothetical protein AVDCRST_MAG28-4203 [uncultured Rubrobacteraceae bacterium]|uniref:Uncharacterized protein n=1 Tax=uncultured Rubrobacteraceae bacterium TaxID=349277 RepID=A0A6J4RGS4_9ACTN|nr:MAG: hypothetical protein AVDCRST_MAG28-4203 [uncultured Rubrobacteraceae bacterium]
MHLLGTLQWTRHAYDTLLSAPVKRLLIVAVIVLAVSLGYRTYGSPETGTGSLTLPQPSPNTDEPAPSFEADQRDGGSFDFSGEGTYVLAFWSTLNKDTADARPEFDRLARDYASKDISFAAVYVSNVLSVPEDEMEVPYAVMQDGSGELTAMYNVKRVPRLFLVHDGTIEMVQNGYYAQNEKSLREELDRIVEENAT